MRTFNFKRFRWGLALVALLMVLSAVPFGNIQHVAAQTVPATGVVCTTGTSPNPTFTLTTKAGYIVLPDGNTMFMWGYSEGSKPFQHPGPVLCVNEGDTVTIILQNTLPQDASITFPGQENVLANGAAAQPQFSGTTLTSLAPVAPANGGSMTYSFVASSPGSYLYESGTNPAVQVRMGLFGALIVRPALGVNYANNNPTSQFNPDTEFLVLFSEIDPYLNQAVENGRSFNMNNYKPRYWLINGRGFPDSIADNYASWLPNQPYGALARIHPYDPVMNPDYALEHFMNVGTEVVPMHPHAKNALIVNRDGRPVEGTGGQDLAWENFSVPVGPGQTYDGIFRWKDAEGYDSATNPVPVTIPDVANMVYGMFYSGSPYLGEMGPMPPGMSTLNQCGEYYIIAHNHALYQITSWGVPMTGPITYLRIDPPMGPMNMCP